MTWPRTTGVPVLFPRPGVLPASSVTCSPTLSLRKEGSQARQQRPRAGECKGQFNETTNWDLATVHSDRRPCSGSETRRGTAAGYSVHMGIFTDHSGNGKVWAYTLGTTHVPRTSPPLVTSSWSPAQCHSCP